MTRLCLASAAALLAALASAAAEQAEPPLQAGSYEVAYRLELPHLERWAISRTASICVPQAEGSEPRPLPVLSSNTPFGNCSAENIVQEGATLTYFIVCEGRDAAKARAVFRIGADTFSGRILMIMGAKNMVMTEVQVGRRIGTCESARASVD